MDGLMVARPLLASPAKDTRVAPAASPRSVAPAAAAAVPEDNYRAFGDEIDGVKKRIFAELGNEDVTYVKRLNYASRALEVIGRGLIHFSFEPFTFSAGVVALWLHKQLQATEIGHSALHGAYDRLPGGEKFNSKTFRWDTPIDEASWREGHNVRHHGATNVAGKDPDVHFGPVRLTDKTPHQPAHRFQLPFALLVIFPNFGFLMNLHFSGLLDAYAEYGLPGELGALPDRSKASVRMAWRRALRKYLPFYLKEYVFFPLLAGPFFWKVLLGNWLAETMRDIYSAATIFCGHVGDDVHSFDPGTKASGRGAWYAMQVQATNNYEVSLPISVLCGGLDKQIEHHLFPTLPPPRLRQIAPEVREICERHGLPYKTASWGKTLGKALRHIKELARVGGTREVVRAMA